MKRAEEIAGNDQRKLSGLQAVAERCDGVENVDRCDLAADILACLKGSSS